jgi:hypothetical protein
MFFMPQQKKRSLGIKTIIISLHMCASVFVPIVRITNRLFVGKTHQPSQRYMSAAYVVILLVRFFFCFLHFDLLLGVYLYAYIVRASVGLIFTRNYGVIIIKYVKYDWETSTFCTKTKRKNNNETRNCHLLSMKLSRKMLICLWAQRETRHAYHGNV